MKHRFELSLTLEAYQELCENEQEYLEKTLGANVSDIKYLYEEEVPHGMNIAYEVELSSSLIVGAIKGRHDLPVEDYIFDGAVNPLELEGIYETVSKKLDGFTSVTLYVTGLTVVTTTVMKYCFKNNISLTLMHYDRDSNSYYPQEIL